MPLFGLDGATKTVKSYCSPSVSIEVMEATTRSTLTWRFCIVPAKGTGKEKPAASGGIVDSPVPSMVSTVLLPKPMSRGAAETTVAPERIVPLEKTINPPPGPVGPVGPGAPDGPVAPAAPAGPVGPAAPVGPVGPVTPVGPVGPVAPSSAMMSQSAVSAAGLPALQPATFLQK